LKNDSPLKEWIDVLTDILGVKHLNVCLSNRFVVLHNRTVANRNIILSLFPDLLDHQVLLVHQTGLLLQDSQVPQELPELLHLQEPQVILDQQDLQDLQELLL
jgi:hypothetical protein